MNTNELSKHGYNVAELNRFSKKIRNRKLYRIVLGGLLFCGVAFLIAQYIARLPRERYARDFGFVDRVVLGSKRAMHAAFLTISADNEDGAQSELEIAELYIRGKRLDRLNESLPASGRDFQKAKFRYAGEVLEGEARYRGDSMNHWAFPQKSFRVVLEKTDTIDGMRALNLTVPRSDTQIANWLGYELARRSGGLLVPDSEMVHFRLNRKFDGIRLLVEQPDEAFLRRRQLPPGKLFIGDITSEQIYGGVERARLYHKAGAWEVRAPGEELGREELASLFRVLGQTDPYRLYYKLEKMVDVESFLRYMALLEFVGSIHVDATHNGKLYFNPESGKFYPVVWDTVAYFWGNRQPLDLGTNELFRALLSVPEFRDRKDRILWDMVRGSFTTESMQTLIQTQVDRMRKDVYAFPLKIHANDKGVRHISNSEWEASIERLLNTVAERNAFIEKRVGEHAASYHVEMEQGNRRARIAIANNGVESLALKSLTVRSTGTTVLKRIGIDAVLKPVREDAATVVGTEIDGTTSFALDDTLRSGRSFKKGSRGALVPGVYIYEIEARTGTIEDIKTPVVQAAISGGEVAVTKDPSLLGLYSTSTGWWEPDRFVEIQPVRLAGTVKIEKDLLLDDYSRLEIAPGTKIQIAPQTSILVRRGGVIAHGTEAAPIEISALSSDYPWGVFAVQGGSAEIEHLKVSGGSERKIQNVFYKSALAMHSAEVNLKNISLTDVELDLQHSKGTVDGLLYSGVQRTGFLSSDSIVKITNVKKTGREPIHKLSDYTGAVYGTPPRAEREFKLTLTGDAVERLTLDEISNEMHTALTSAVENPALWSAPRYTNTNYYHDVESKDFLFRDIYFDTKDQLNYQYGVSYRYRNRYKGRNAYEYHLKKPNWSEHWPHRLEFQAKVNRQELPGGFSTVDEARFEFRSASKPFSEENLPPEAPWEEDTFVPYFMDGKYKGIATAPAKAVVEYLRSRGINRTEFAFEPANIMVTDRYRQHLNIKTIWGSGPNPDQSFIISLDRSEIFQPTPYLDYLRRKRLGYKKLPRPEPVGVLVEVEIEYERNVSDVLDKQIIEAQKSGDTKTEQELSAVRDAFIADLQVIKDTITKHFATVQVEVVPAQQSKYLQAMDILKQ